VWDAESGSVVAVLEGHEAPVVSASFSPDGTRILTGSEDRTARIWDAASGRAIAKLEVRELRRKGILGNEWVTIRRRRVGRE